MLKGMHPILNFDNQREFQNRQIEHMHVPIHVVDAPKIEKNEDSNVVEFIDKQSTCALPDETKYSEVTNLVKKVKTQHHTPTSERKLI